MQPYELNAPVSRLEEHAHHRFERVGWGSAGLALLAVSAQALAAPHVFTLTRTLLAGLAAGGIWLTVLKAAGRPDGDGEFGRAGKRAGPADGGFPAARITLGGAASLAAVAGRAAPD